MKHKHHNSIDFTLANVCYLHRLRIEQLVNSLGLYQGQPRVLRELWEQDGVTQTELIQRLKLTPATVTRMLQRMEKAHFIYRKPDSHDLRVSRVYLTDAGRAVQGQVEATWQTIEEETFANLSLEERLLLHRLLLQMRDNLLEVTGERPWD